ncbi:hypothetical protein [Caballeronia temeraria]|nr:hypothetical protein [Caballeronia temeraria]
MSTFNKFIPENSQVQIGLVTQGHIPMVERMLEGGALWQEIGRAINWDAATAAEQYATYAFAQLKHLRGSSKGIADASL